VESKYDGMVMYPRLGSMCPQKDFYQRMAFHPA